MEIEGGRGEEEGRGVIVREGEGEGYRGECWSSSVDRRKYSHIYVTHTLISVALKGRGSGRGRGRGERELGKEWVV